MDRKFHFYVVDDDYPFLLLIKRILEKGSHKVTTFMSPSDAFKSIYQDRPDCVITDIMMPEIDGLEFIRKIRESEELSNTKVIVLSSKAYDFDKQQALDLGADGYFIKSIDTKTFLKDVLKVLIPHMVLTFWGVRGTLPLPGPNSLQYGGNTSCITIEFPEAPLFIFDAGTGLKQLSDYLMRYGSKRLEARIFISHSHWDHINAFPFFAPLYISGNKIQIYGPAQGNISIEEALSSQMKGIYFPITIREFGAYVQFQDLSEGIYEFDKIVVKTTLLNHPGYDLGYRIEYFGKSVCYITDNELYPLDSPFHSESHMKKLIEFINGAEILIHDTTYSDEKYSPKVRWGHSAVSQVVELAIKAKIKSLYLFHHDPDDTDEDIDKKIETAQGIIEKKGADLLCQSAKEKERVIC